MPLSLVMALADEGHLPHADVSGIEPVDQRFPEIYYIIRKDSVPISVNKLIFYCTWFSNCNAEQTVVTASRAQPSRAEPSRAAQSLVNSKAVLEEESPANPSANAVMRKSLCFVQESYIVGGTQASEWSNAAMLTYTWCA
jgi:hypothetical protein